MSIWKLVFRSLVFYRRTHSGTVLGTALATAILVGALVVGDSVRFSLRQMVSERLGTTTYALETDTRYFRQSLAENLSQRLSTAVAPLLQTTGMAIIGGGEAKANRVQVVGVDPQISEISKTQPEFWDLSADEAIVNQQMADRLNLKIGDQILLRLLKSESFSRDAPLSRDTDLTIARRFIVKSIANASHFGHFSLKSNQVTPYTVFVSFSDLATSMEIENRANTLLIAEHPVMPLDEEKVKQAMEKEWTLNDIGLFVHKPNSAEFVELKTDRIFLEPVISTAVQKMDPMAKPVFTYFVNELRSAGQTTPYSFVSAPGAPIVPPDLMKSEIIINQWLASDLKVKVGDSLSIVYYVIGPMRQLIEKTSRFRIKSIVPLSGIYADKALMPDFPGLAGEENCRDWDPGIPVDFDKIRNKDEKYWDLFRGTPKAFISLNAAQSLWENRFGNLTAIRFYNSNVVDIEQKLKTVLDPATFGLIFRPVRNDGIRSSSESVDFAELFLGLSFFIIVAAMILTGLLFILTIEQRSKETGLYLALGFSGKMIRKLVFYESGLLAIIGVLFGGFLGVVYNQIILFALKTIWKDAVGTTVLNIHIDFASIFTGLGASLAIALLTMFLVVRKQGKQQVSALQAGLSISDQKTIKQKSPLSLFVGLAGLLIALAIILLTGAGRGKAATGAFFTAGTLLLISGISFTNFYLNRMQMKSSVKPNLLKIGIRNASRTKTRSLLLVGLLASGLFIVFTVGANRHGVIQNPYERSSGTGGFAFYAQSLIPVLYDLNSEKGREFYSLEDIDRDQVSFIPFRVKEGEDASCLNLNRVASPQLIGFNPEALDRRKAFRFSTLTDEVDPEHPWMSLIMDTDDAVIPGIADETVIIWGLGKSVGDTLEYIDEKGRPFRIRLVASLANSIFQGNVLVAENVLIKKYPSLSGHRLFLVDSPAAHAESVLSTFSWAMQDMGIDISRTADRLAEFNKVENTYLSIFLILGGFGLLLGTVGLGIVVMRNILERRGELALLKAVGFNKSAINKLIFSEHILLLMLGIISGFITALIAVFPALITPGGAVPYMTILVTLLVILISGGLWISLATWFAVRGDLLPALRNE